MELRGSMGHHRCRIRKGVSYPKDISCSAPCACHRAARSLDLDFANSSAHLFAVAALIGLPDRTAAAGSELPVARFLLPVNQNAFKSFYESTSLSNTPCNGGNIGFRSTSAVAKGGSNRVTCCGLLKYRSNGVCLGVPSDQSHATWSGLAKAALGANQDPLFDSCGLKSEQGDIGGIRIIVEDASAAAPIRIMNPERPQLNTRLNATVSENFVGHHNHFLPDHHVLMSASYADTDLTSILPKSDALFTDIASKKEFAHKRGRAGFAVNNLFNEVSTSSWEGSRSAIACRPGMLNRL